ncbi:MAG: hypothetical protein BGN96_03975 [Bacteroidales bacterium 45-6]|nr:MAG: hypothetical protein BGN96_03975 [Bacteroidales bacterium 45-6]
MQRRLIFEIMLCSIPSFFMFNLFLTFHQYFDVSLVAAKIGIILKRDLFFVFIYVKMAVRHSA